MPTSKSDLVNSISVIKILSTALVVLKDFLSPDFNGPISINLLAGSVATMHTPVETISIIQTRAKSTRGC
jgi:hypothetical protein